MKEIQIKISEIQIKTFKAAGFHVGGLTQGDYKYGGLAYFHAPK